MILKSFLQLFDFWMREFEEPKIKIWLWKWYSFFHSKISSFKHKKGKAFKIIYSIYNTAYYQKNRKHSEKMYKASSFHEYTNPRTFFQNFLAHYTMPLTTKVWLNTIFCPLIKTSTFWPLLDLKKLVKLLNLPTCASIFVDLRVPSLCATTKMSLAPVFRASAPSTDPK